MVIERNSYLEKLMKKMWNGQIEVITGLRRSGKSFLLFNLFRSKLLSDGVQEKDIVSLALDEEESIAFRDPSKLNEYLKKKTADSSRKYYVLLDEVQYAISKEELRSKEPPRLYGVLNGLLRKNNIDVYVTGSNSKLLSSDVMTEFRGRGDELQVFPLLLRNFFLYAEKIKKRR